MTKSELEKALENARKSWGVSYEDSKVIIAAARRFADLLPEECETCHHTESSCGNCDGLGWVWRPEVVERVAAAIYYNVRIADKGGEKWELLDSTYQEWMRKKARAVLAALTEEEK